MCFGMEMFVQMGVAFEGVASRPTNQSSDFPSSQVSDFRKH